MIPGKGSKVVESQSQSLLSPAFLKKLEQLRIHARRAFPGTMRGERRSPRRGSSVEFADFRKYAAGDDFRHVDWNIYARLDRLMLRQFGEEEDVRIDILLDHSRSMHFGEPRTKFDAACRTAAALAFLGIGTLDRVSVRTFDSEIRARTRALRGRGHFASILSFLDGLIRETESAIGPETEEGESGQEVKEEPPTNLKGVLGRFQHQVRKPGVIFVLSDFLDAGDYQSEVKLLCHKGFEVNLIQVMAPDELKVPGGGDLLLVDSETGEEREFVLNDRAVAAYRASVSAFLEGLKDFCRRVGAGYLLLEAGQSFEDLLLRNLIESRMTE